MKLTLDSLQDVSEVAPKSPYWVNYCEQLRSVGIGDVPLRHVSDTGIAFDVRPVWPREHTDAATVGDPGGPRPWLQHVAVGDTGATRMWNDQRESWT